MRRAMCVDSRRTSRNVAQRLPDPLLEGCTPHIERQIEAERRRLDKADHPGHYVLKVMITTEQLGPGEAVLEIAHQGIGVVAEQDGADPLVRGGDQDRTQRALADGEVHRGPVAAGAEL